MRINGMPDIIIPTWPKRDAHGFVNIQMQIGDAAKLMKNILRYRPMGSSIMNDGTDVIRERLETGARQLQGQHT